jgi:hypothetical protein
MLQINYTKIMDAKKSHQKMMARFFSLLLNLVYPASPQAYRYR